MTPQRLTSVIAGCLVLLCVAFGSAPAKASTLNGVVQTGGTNFPRPLRNVNVTLYEATTGSPNAIGTARTNFRGEFAIDSPKDSTESIFFATADVNLGVQFVTVIGPELLPEITINELTTVAASYSMAQFYRTGEISGNSFGLRIAAGMNDNIVSPVTGESSEVLLTSPNADQTISLRLTRSLANLLSAATNNFVVRLLLLQSTTSYGSSFPCNTSVALANLARDPGQNVLLLYVLSKFSNAYSPALASWPDAWTVTVKVNDSGDDRFLFGGPGGLAFDKNGYAWIVNNVTQGTPNSSRRMMILQPNGKPSDGTNGTPVSPITGGGILGGGLGISVDKRNTVWQGNFGWGTPKPSADGNGSVSRFTLGGMALSPPNAYQGGPVRVQGIESNDEGNVFICSYGNDSVFVFPQGDPLRSVGFQQYRGSSPFDIAITPDGSAWVTNGGGLTGTFPSTVAKFEFKDGELHRRVIRRVGKALKSVVVDSYGNVWVCSQGDSTIYVFDPSGRRIGEYTGGGIDGPWGLAVDGEDNIWVANFGPLGFRQGPFSGRLSKLYGANPAGRPWYKRMGDPVSPSTGYTVPSAGDPVLLHNGEQLYGGERKSYIPMMRQTGVEIDQAGNLWSINNWKPLFGIDTIGMNPGGDGIVIFVGMAPPPPSKFDDVDDD